MSVAFLFRCDWFVFAIVLFPASLAFAQEKPAAAEILSRVRRDHPRLLASDADFVSLKASIADPRVATVFAAVRANADAIVARPVSRFELRDGVRLLYVSREVREAVLSLALVYRLTGEERYAERLWAEVDSATSFPNWNPKHFLDTAEMTFAIAIAYDWCFERWTEAQRVKMRQALLEKGLKPGLGVYHWKTGGFAQKENNWNQVCNGGMLVGALAIAEDEPSVAGEVLERAIASLPVAMKNYAPDGAWSEGPGYWQYATEYNCLALAALRSATGSDFGLAAMPGFSTTGDMPLAFTGPIGLTFNYADAGSGFAGAPTLFWLASAFDTPAYAAFQVPYAKARPRPLDLLWGASWMAKEPAIAKRPLDLRFRRDNLVYLRSAWGDPRALFVGFKGGDNRVSHAHLDLGSFVFDAMGQRWAMDPGPDDYNRPGYFGANRWKYYRCRAEGNNCLLINPGNGPDQSPTATAEVTQFYSDAGRGSAVIDLTNAYAENAKSVRRGIAMLDEHKRVLIQDEVRAEKPVEFVWFMHTDAAIAIAEDGASAKLTKGGETLTARIASPGGAKFTVSEAKSLPTSPPEPPAATQPVVGFRNRLKDLRKLTIRIGDAKDLCVAVTLTPGEDDDEAANVVPLEKWPTAEK